MRLLTYLGFVILVHSRDDRNKSKEWKENMSLLRSLLVDENIQWPTGTRPGSSTHGAGIAAAL
jgi:hypothetical protein